MENDWLRPNSEWGLRTWVVLVLLCVLPVGLIILLFTVGIH
jgi:hypothetical protein